jgi:hypothetical protein
MIESMSVVSNAAMPMRLAGRRARFIWRAKGPYALIACIRGTTPTICMARLRL